MDYFSEESVLNLLYSYNPWWKTGIVQKEFDKPMKRASFFESKKAFDNNEIRRTVLLSGSPLWLQTIHRIVCYTRRAS